MEPLIRKEQKIGAQKLELFATKMKESLAETAKSKAGVNVLRFLLHESRFLQPLAHETSIGINTDLLIESEAKRRLYLTLRSYMDADTIKRVEFEEEQEETNDRP